MRLARAQSCARREAHVPARAGAVFAHSGKHLQRERDMPGSLPENNNSVLFVHRSGSAQQFEYLHLRGCDEIQGFWFSAPLEPEACLAFLARHRRSHSQPAPA